MSEFEHSVKPPRDLKAAANLLKTVTSEAGPTASLARLRTESRLLHPRRNNVKHINSLVVDTIKLDSKYNSFFDEIDLLNIEPRLDPFLAKIIFTELLTRKTSINNESKPVLTVLKYYRTHEDRLRSFARKLEENVKKVFKPRYVRINTLYSSTADAVKQFRDEGWNHIRCTSTSYNDYLRQLENLKENDFIADFHVKVVYAFPPGTSFHNSSMYNNWEIFLQDKATCLASFLLSPTSGSTILDMCAAPGMKTSHLASMIKNDGKIYSIEQDQERCKMLKEFIENAGITCVEILNRDVMTVTKNDCKNVDYILLDPSCSGSGIDRIDNNDLDFDLNSGRIEKLSRFQAKLLRHTLNEFRTAKRVVYSTCSLYPQENEEVIQDVIQSHKGKFRLVSAKKKLNNNWNNIGDSKYCDVGEKCLYARPESDYTTGFFIAIFEQEVNDEFSTEVKNKEVQNNNLSVNRTQKNQKTSVKKEVHDISGDSIMNSDKYSYEIENKLSAESKILNVEKSSNKKRKHRSIDIDEIVKEKKNKNRKKCVTAEISSGLQKEINVEQDLINIDDESKILYENREKRHANKVQKKKKTSM